MSETPLGSVRENASHSLVGRDWNPTHPSFFVEWDEDTGQFKMVSDGGR